MYRKITIEIKKTLTVAIVFLTIMGVASNARSITNFSDYEVMPLVDDVINEDFV